jgi:imidazole glycerol-phosphate synthase subunit HisH
MIAIVDYGSGNVHAIANILRQLRVEYVITADRNELIAADRYILPGVGAFDQTMHHLASTGVSDVLHAQVTQHRKYLLGVCVGMQLLATSSEEGSLSGLNWVPGVVRRLPTDVFRCPPHTPHMGWNSISVHADCPLLADIDLEHGFYFLHSYGFVPEHSQHSIASTHYGSDIVCVVNRENVFGVQFHPEKSHRNGVQLLRNFASL